MDNAIVSQFLGINDNTLKSIFSGHMPNGLNQLQGDSQFASQLETLLNNQFSVRKEDQQELMNSAVQPSFLQLNELYKNISLSSLREENENKENIDEISKSVNNDITNKNTKVNASDIVYATGNANINLIESMNASTTIKERLEFAVQLRDKIIEALKEGGYTAHDIGKPDKISIDGEIIDVIRASRRMGRNGAVQFMKVDIASKSDSNTTKDAIFNAGEMYQDILSELNSTSSLNDRKNAGAIFINQVINKLIENGFEAKRIGSFDKIEVNGQTYDIIRGLNNTGSSPVFQVMKVT